MNKRKKKLILIVTVLIFIIVMIFLISNQLFVNSIRNNVTVDVKYVVNDSSINVDYIVSNASNYDITVELRKNNLNDGKFFPLSDGEGDSDLVNRNSKKTFETKIHCENEQEARAMAKKLFNGEYTLMVKENLKNNKKCEFNFEIN